MLSLRPAAAGPIPCKICNAPAPVYGIVDLNRNCWIAGGVMLPDIGVPVSYRRCGTCGFLFTDAFDDWSQSDFKTHIYNEGYQTVDPAYNGERPRMNALLVKELFAARKEERRVLDYGGGNDVLCSELRAAGFPVAVTYDPFIAEFAQPPSGKFDLVTCFETLEHMSDPIPGIGAIVACLADPGLVIFSTLVQPQDFARFGMNWWYVGPRNGHVSLFSRDALARAWRHHGLNVISLTDNVHLAFRNLPDFARHRFKPA
ncbi:MAG TPA: class I SAM-dependent methyltransferase [Pseudolabrys sp.]|nr:class I SAM-dependent methyltransferase [Pseudolabrys sp.]